MANTYSQLYVHIVFAVKRRASLISKSWREELFKYTTGIVTNDKQKLMIINGVEDHVHILVGFKPDCTISDLVRDIKANSSRWINEKRLTSTRFEWQGGFGAFSVCPRNIKSVIDYIQRQEEIHRERAFREEYLMLLEEYEIDYRNEYIFDEPM